MQFIFRHLLANQYQKLDVYSIWYGTNMGRERKTESSHVKYQQRKCIYDSIILLTPFDKSMELNSKRSLSAIENGRWSEEQSLNIVVNTEIKKRSQQQQEHWTAKCWFFFHSPSSSSYSAVRTLHGREGKKSERIFTNNIFIINFIFIQAIDELIQRIFLVWIIYNK